MCFAHRNTVIPVFLSLFRCFFLSRCPNWTERHGGQRRKLYRHFDLFFFLFPFFYTTLLRATCVAPRRKPGYGVSIVIHAERVLRGALSSLIPRKLIDGVARNELHCSQRGSSLLSSRGITCFVNSEILFRYALYVQRICRIGVPCVRASA